MTMAATIYIQVQQYSKDRQLPIGMWGDWKSPDVPEWVSQCIAVDIELCNAIEGYVEGDGQTWKWRKCSH